MQNIIIFLLLNIFFLHVVSSLAHGVSVFSFTLFKQSILHNVWLVLTTLIAVLLVSWVKRASTWLLAVVIIWTGYNGVLYYLEDFSKLILVLLFAYLMTGGIFFLFWFLEMEEAHYHPMFNKRDIGNRDEFSIRCELELGDKKYHGFLTNWSETSCFAVFPDAEIKKIRGDGELVIYFNRVKYRNLVSIFTEYGDGVGMVMLNSERGAESDYYLWNDLFVLLLDRGLNPKFRQQLEGV